MQQFIDNLISRLEEQKTKYREIRKNTYCRRTEMDDCDSCRADHYLDARLEGINKAKEIVNQLAEEYKGGWIPCSERFPENDENVLVWFEYFRFGEYNRLYQTYGISHTFRGEWSGFVNGQSGWRQLRVIAWLPLPEPYRKEGE